MLRDITLEPGSLTIGGRPGRSVVVVIGIDRYLTWPRLFNAVSDATGASQLFQRLGFTEVVAPLLDGAATREAMWRLVTDDLAKLAPDDSLVLFFAGHGHTRLTYPDGKPTKIGYVIPVDAAEQGDRAATWVRLDFWLNEVAILPPRHILVIIDACHSGVALDAVVKWRGASLSTEALHELQARRSRRIITSALDDQRAMDGGPFPGHSLFTGCLIEGLTSGLAAGGLRIATGSQIGLYVQGRVSSYPKSMQTPDFGALDLDQRGELVVPLLGAAEHSEPEPKQPQKSDPAGMTLAGLSLTQLPIKNPTSSRVSTDRRFAVASALAIIVGGAAIGFAVTRKTAGGLTEPQTVAMAATMEQLNGDIKAARGKIQERAATLSGLLSLRAAIATDKATVNDLVERGDFRPKDDEILELGRIDKATSVVERLKLLPEDEMSASHDGMTGSYADLVGDKIKITEVAKVEPTDLADRYAGFLSVTRRLAFAPAIKQLVAVGIAGKFVINDKEIPIGVMPAGATTREQQLSAQDGAKIVVVEPPPRRALSLLALVGGMGGAVFGLLLLLVGMLGKRGVVDSSTRQFDALPTQPTAPPPSTSGDQPTFANANTQPSQHDIAEAEAPASGDPVSIS